MLRTPWIVELSSRSAIELAGLLVTVNVGSSLTDPFADFGGVLSIDDDTA
jgi:hypothetical protein